MSRLVYRQGPLFTANPLKPFVPSLGVWGVGVGAAALLFLSVTPLVKRELLVKVPILGSYYEDKIPASDKPF